MKKLPARKDRRSLITPLLLAAMTLLLFLFGGSQLSTPPMDDVYIHLVYGRSLLSSAPLNFNDGEPSSGFTSPLWLVPSALASLAGTQAAPLALMLLSLIAACVAVFLLPPITGLVLLMTGPFFFHASSGMETALSCLAVVLTWKWLEGDRNPSAGSLLLPASFLVRPELAVLSIPMALALPERTPLRLARLFAPAAAAGLLWMLWNLHSMGLPLPSTFYAKQSVSWFSAASAGLPGLLKGLLLTSPLLLFAAGVSVASLLKAGKERRHSISMALMPLLLFAVSILLQPNSYFQMRYHVPALAASALAAGSWLYGLGRRKRLNVLILAASMLPGLMVYGGRRIDAAADVHAIDVHPARYLSSIAASGETVAAADIGAVRWFTDMYILDLDGLVSREMLHGRNGPNAETVLERADYLLAFPRQYSETVAHGEGRLEFLAGFGSPANVICGEDSVGLWKVR